MDPFGIESTLMNYLRAIGWSIAAAIGFSFGIGLAIKVFDWLSTDIDEWEEIKKGNIGVALIFVSLIVMVGLLLGVGMASVASLAMAAIIPIVFAILYLTGYASFGTTPAYLIGGILAALIVAWALRPNIKRILNGTERVVGPRARRKQAKQTS